MIGIQQDMTLKSEDRNLIELDYEVKQIKKDCEEAKETIAKMKESIYNPDEGLFSRVRTLESWKEQAINRVVEKMSTCQKQIDDKFAATKTNFENQLKLQMPVPNGELRIVALESAIANLRKIQWILIGAFTTTIVTLAVTGIIKHFFGG